MTKDLALAIDGSETAYGVHRQQLKATDNFVAGKKHTDPYTLRNVENLDPEFHPSMNMPYDLRYMVLQHIVPSQNIRAFLCRESVGLSLPTIAYAGNTQLRRECLLVALNSCTMDIHSSPGNARLQAWLAKVDFTGVSTSCKTGFDAITSLTFPYFSYFRYGTPGITTNNDLGLAMACKNLRSLSLHFASSELARIALRCQGQEDEFEVAAAMLRENYQLDGILKLDKLELLHVNAYGSEDALRGLRKLLAWFEAEFERLGRRVVIEVV